MLGAIIYGMSPYSVIPFRANFLIDKSETSLTTRLCSLSRSSVFDAYSKALGSQSACSMAQMPAP